VNTAEFTEENALYLQPIDSRFRRPAAVVKRGEEMGQSLPIERQTQGGFARGTVAFVLQEFGDFAALPQTPDEGAAHCGIPFPASQSHRLSQSGPGGEPLAMEAQHLDGDQATGIVRGIEYRPERLNTLGARDDLTQLVDGMRLFGGSDSPRSALQ